MKFIIRGDSDDIISFGTYRNDGSLDWTQVYSADGTVSVGCGTHIRFWLDFMGLGQWKAEVIDSGKAHVEVLPDERGDANETQSNDVKVEITTSEKVTWANVAGQLIRFEVPVLPKLSSEETVEQRATHFLDFVQRDLVRDAVGYGVLTAEQRRQLVCDIVGAFFGREEEEEGTLDIALAALENANTGLFDQAIMNLQLVKAVARRGSL